MSNPLASRGVHIPPELLYCPKISAAVLHTWAQVRGLADANDEVRFKNGMQELVTITGKFKQTLYGHLASLRDMQALRFASSKDGELFIKFDDKSFLEYASKIFTHPLSLNPPDQVNDLTREDLRGEAVKIFDQKRETKDPLLSHPAIMVYRSVTHLTANFVQRKQITEIVGFDDQGWKASLEHWMMHGYSPTNVLGMLDSFQKGGKAACKACQRNGSKPETPANPRPAWTPEELAQYKRKVDK